MARSGRSERIVMIVVAVVVITGMIAAMLATAIVPAGR